MVQLYKQQRFIFMALDPVHIGTGQTRIGRVDNTIVRETGTNIPKIPGTSLMGAARSYSSLVYGKPEAAGQHLKLKPEERKNCPIVYTFGTYNNGNNDAVAGQQGKISISDAQILFFPVYSMAGPVWVSTSKILALADFQVNGLISSADDVLHTSLKWSKETLNLGWLHLKAKNGLIVKPPGEIENKKEWESIKQRIVIVSIKLFSQIVNSNLEVRTSVAINPETGAAEDGALFTYEAIPRATWFWSDVVQDDYTSEFPKTKKQFTARGENSGEELPSEWNSPLDVVKSGFEVMEFLGIGGMTTRGFGRVKCIADREV
ncbi:MAG TPA: type III-B CRISPR module RAMP protein Cmr4 [Methanosarcina sp.]|jgi:CRISPR-associated protein Cmr4|nr:type III-B CRISPR module RAMP protein Cmr4 [Methanosarcina sp.]